MLSDGSLHLLLELQHLVRVFCQLPVEVDHVCSLTPYSAGGGEEAEVSVEEEIKNGSNSVYLHLMRSLRSQV